MYSSVTSWGHDSVYVLYVCVCVLKVFSNSYAEIQS